MDGVALEDPVSLAVMESEALKDPVSLAVMESDALKERLSLGVIELLGVSVTVVSGGVARVPLGSVQKNNKSSAMRLVGGICRAREACRWHRWCTGAATAIVVAGRRPAVEGTHRRMGFALINSTTLQRSHRCRRKRGGEPLPQECSIASLVSKTGRRTWPMRSPTSERAQRRQMRQPTVRAKEHRSLLANVPRPCARKLRHCQRP